MNESVIYCRVSSKEQEREGFSIPAQRKLLREYASQHDLSINKEFTDVETAKSAGRTQFGKMVEYLKTHSDIKTILVEKTDRLYRNFKDYVLLEELDLQIHLVKENETISRESRSHAKFVHGIKVLLAKNYIDNLSEEVKKGMKEKAEQGHFPGRAPFGYTNDKSTHLVKVDQERAPLVTRLFEMYASGEYSLAAIRNKAHAEGWTAPNGGKFAKSMIERILKNPFYTGDFEWKGTLYRGKHEAVISREQFDAVQAALSAGPHARSRTHTFLFKGLLTCRNCGCAIVGEIKKGRYIYYHCTQAKGKCNHPWIREEKLDQKAAEMLTAIQVDQNAIDEIVRALKDSFGQERSFRESEEKRLRRREKELQSRIDKAYEDRLDGVIDESYWREISGKWQAEQALIRSQLSRFTRANRNYVDEALEILELSKLAYSLYLRQNSIEKRKLLKKVLSNCTSDGTSLYPTYRNPFDLVAEGVKNQIKLPR